MSNAVRSKITIKQVAEASGVAPSTVSNALTGKGYVSEETRGRVLQAAQSLGYRASSLARSLRLQQTWSVGLLVADVSNPFFPAVVRGVEDVLWRRQYNLVLCNTDYNKEKEAAYLRHLLDKRLDGLILASTAADSDDVLELQAEGVPFVMLNRRHVSARTPYVGMDNEGGVGMAMDHLLALGHRRIAFIKGRADSSAAEERHQGYRQALEREAIAYDPALVMQGDYTIESGHAAAARFLALRRPPTAIVSANDFMAFGAMALFKERGLAVPSEMSVIGFDDIFVSALPWIELTTVRPQSWQLGASAAELLLELVGGREANRRREIILPNELVLRATTAPARPER
ncbi:MAG TPA: LacI family DNA-binding transcriptional regulator [Hypericibacter adhaerens]|jgi:DNA-binding LacI/PurR family transcriptional regulator|uniref:LacI family transcriptional regulator n=1 Tax=Hypericibacter adhaerens TaxID=2602016 RepID=A0A5J6MXN4_9PROT|nr:LacI family DNA-binding transcriptional regulator [Hypericibacter adhaerens]QEX20990.1 LacI family transcriptional regulator [Hypericibacter adhaerens]HWA45306.1 LacI family DNA-binding transcriptional regulator [Hypericibacter adhaerens]